MGYKSQTMRGTQEKYLDATLKILRPLVRMLLRVGVSHSEFSELARKAFVETAHHDFKLDNKKQTISRVATLTGLSRKEVQRLLGALERPVTKEPRPVNRVRRVINGWLTDPEFRARGLTLPLYGEAGSFAELVRRYSGDVPSGAILDELLRIGAATRHSDAVALTDAGYIPAKEPEEKITILGESTRDLLETLDHNLHHAESEAPKFQRSVVYHQLPDELAAEFEAYSQAKSAELLADLNQWLAARKRNLSRYQYGTRRVGVGVYYFGSTESDEESPNV